MSKTSQTITIPPSAEYETDGTTLTKCNSFRRAVVLPEGIESVQDGAFATWDPPLDIRSRVVFPDSLRQLTWQQFRELGDVTVQLPSAFLTAGSGDSLQTALQPLREGWQKENITLASAARAYLLKEPQEAALAQSILTEDVTEQAARLMAGILRDRQESNRKIPPRVMLRAVVFFVRNVQLISQDVVEDLVRLLPDRKTSGRSYSKILDPDLRPYHMALLDFILRAVGITPGDSIFRRAGNPDIIKAAVVPYIAEGLNVAIHDHASPWLPWVRETETAEDYLLELHNPGQFIRVLKNHLSKEHVYDCAVLFGQYSNMFGDGDMLQQLAELLDGLEPGSKRSLQVQTGLALGPMYPITIPDIDDRLVQRYVEMEMQSPLRRLFLSSSGFTGDEYRARATYTFTPGDAWEVFVGPNLQMRWRGVGERNLRPASAMMEFALIPIMVMGDDEAREQAYKLRRLKTILQDFKKRVQRVLMTHYLNDIPLEPRAVKHMIEDLTLMQTISGLVWEQNGRTFTVSDGHAVNAAGEQVEIEDGPVRIAYAPEMDPAEVASWRAYFERKKYDSWMGHMEETGYSLEDIAEDRYKDTFFRDSAVEKPKMLPIITLPGGSPGSRMSTRIEIPLPYEALDLMYKRRTNGFDLGEIKVTEMNRLVSRVLFQLDMATLDERIGRDDITVLPLLERAPDKARKKALKNAEKAGAATVQAALEAMIEKDSSTKRRGAGRKAKK